MIYAPDAHNGESSTNDLNTHLVFTQWNYPWALELHFLNKFLPNLNDGTLFCSVKYTIQVPEWFVFVFFCWLKCFSVWLLAEIPLDALMKQYAGAYVDSFEWPQPSPGPSDEEDMEETEGALVITKCNCSNDHPHSRFRQWNS